MSNNAKQVSENIHALVSDTERACLSGIDRATTKLLHSAVDDMAGQIPIPRSRLQKNVSRLSRPTINNMRSGILVKKKGILLHNYPHMKTNGGVSVKVTNRGGFKRIKGAFIGNKPLKNSNVTGYIAMRTTALIKMLEGGRMTTGITSKIASLNRNMNNSESPKSHISVLHGADEAQLVDSIQDDHRLDKAVVTSFKDEFFLKLRKK